MFGRIREAISRRRQVDHRSPYLAQLSGTGIEIGALQNPVCARHLRIRYVDRLPIESLLEQYPELQGQKIVAPDILDDAEDLGTLPASSQDFVIANHVIEHMANPIKALLSWARVLKVGGRLFLAVPDKRYTFDRDRPCTELAHLFDDYDNPSRERDYAHFLEFSREVSCRTFHARPIEEADEYARELWSRNYSIHFHVWDEARFHELLTALAGRFDIWRMRIVDTMPTTDNEFIVVLEKL